jgi:hypothetical protein
MLSFSKKKAHLLLGRNGEIERARVKEIEREGGSLIHQIYQ